MLSMFKMGCGLLLYILFSILPLTLAMVCPEQGLPMKCLCTSYDQNITSINCTNAGLSDFTNVPAAVSMRFKDNAMEKLTKVPYDGSVVHLYLISNGIETIYDGAFATMTGLRGLNLENNSITCLSSDVFQGLTTLQDLVLSGNPLYYLRADTFVGSILPSLQFLYIDNCQLYDMEDKAVDTLTNLTILSMTHNNLRTIPVLGCPGHSLDNLHNLDVSHNAIDVLHKSNCHLPNLMHLRLGYNNIRRLNATFIGKSITNLRQLHLPHNQLEYIDNKAFEGIQNMSFVDFTYNQLTAINDTAIPWKEIDTILIHDNPWHCDCYNHWLVDTANVAKYNLETSVRCATPARWHNYSVESVDESVFKTCKPKGPSAGRVAGVVIGVLITIIIVLLCTVFAYRLLRNRRRETQSTLNPQMAQNPSKSSIYRRMGPDSSVTFDRRNDDWSEHVSDIGPFEI